MNNKMPLFQTMEREAYLKALEEVKAYINEMDQRLATAEANTKELREELADWAHCKGCFCGHPACRTCAETKDALAMCGIAWKAKAVKGEPTYCPGLSARPGNGYAPCSTRTSPAK